ncbi:MAG: radical SAM protein, partial [Deltaproteobacteria bacterium]|nr:radical SAM protein [Deltaproteobacteria bacterium]
GLKAIDFYLQYVEAIRAKIGNRIPIVLIVEPGSREDMKRLYEAGVSSYNPNYEVWDPELFKILCPGKEKFIGREEWIRRSVEAVDIFGAGSVSPNFVAGVEMAQPWGF